MRLSDGPPSLESRCLICRMMEREWKALGRGHTSLQDKQLKRRARSYFGVFTSGDIRLSLPGRTLGAPSENSPPRLSPSVTECF